LALKTYLVGTITLPIVLLYPALIFSDLAGMGGYDRFATLNMMTEHGVWAPVAHGHTPVYFIFAGAYLIWLLSVANLPIAAVGLISRLARKANSKE
jgi:hypothetical protein